MPELHCIQIVNTLQLPDFSRRAFSRENNQNAKIMSTIASKLQHREKF